MTRSARRLILLRTAGSSLVVTVWDGQTPCTEETGCTLDGKGANVNGDRALNKTIKR